MEGKKMNDEEKIVAEYRKKYETLDEFRVALATLGERLQLNMAGNWQEMTICTPTTKIACARRGPCCVPARRG